MLRNLGTANHLYSSRLLSDKIIFHEVLTLPHFMYMTRFGLLLSVFFCLINVAVILLCMTGSIVASWGSYFLIMRSKIAMLIITILIVLSFAKMNACILLYICMSSFFSCTCQSVSIFVL